MEDVPQVFRLPDSPRVIVYAPLGEAPAEPDEIYAAVPGRDLDRVAAELESIAKANAALEDYHLARRKALASQ